MVIEKRSGDICDGCMDEFWLVQPGEHECVQKDCGCNLHCDTEKRHFLGTAMKLLVHYENTRTEEDEWSTASVDELVDSFNDCGYGLWSEFNIKRDLSDKGKAVIKNGYATTTVMTPCYLESEVK